MRFRIRGPQFCVSGLPSAGPESFRFVPKHVRFLIFWGPETFRLLFKLAFYATSIQQTDLNVRFHSRGQLFFLGLPAAGPENVKRVPKRVRFLTFWGPEIVRLLLKLVFYGTGIRQTDLNPNIFESLCCIT